MIFLSIRQTLYITPHNLYTILGFPFLSSLIQEHTNHSLYSLTEVFNAFLLYAR